MIGNLFDTVLTTPLYNALMAVAAFLPGHSLGWSIIILTAIVRLALFPLAHKSAHTQRKIKELDGQIKEIKSLYKENQQEQAVKIMALYKEHGVNPFSGIALMFIQLPIILALYWVFRTELSLDSDVLYSFTPLPAALQTTFLGFIDLAGNKNYILGLLVAITQYLQVRLSVPSIPKPKESGERSFQDELMRSMGVQMKYGLPIFIGFVAIGLSGAISVYWITNNIVMIGHELLVGKEAKRITQENKDETK